MINLYDGNNVMRRAFEKGQMPNAPLISMRQRYNATTAQDFWVWDGYKHNDRRREVYPAYKMNRSPTPEDIFAQIKLWKDVLKHAPATQLEAHGWEADDVIATLARKFAAQGVPCTIHSNDMDYGQLADLPNVTLNGVNLKGVPPRWIALYKAMQGDSSDNIDGIPGFGPKRWLEMEPYWAQIERAIVANNPAGFVGLPFKPMVMAWLMVPENVNLLRQMLTITHFENVPDDELNGSIIEGKFDFPKANALLSEFFL